MADLTDETKAAQPEKGKAADQYKIHTPIILTADQVYDMDRLPVEFVATPEWANGNLDAGFYVRGLMGVERDQYEESMLIGKGSKRKVSLANARAALVAKCVINGPDPETAQRVFKTRTDVEKLGRVSAIPLNRLFAVAQRLSGLTEEDVEELTENLD